MKKLLIVGAVAIIATGCAYMKSNTYSETRYETNSVAIVYQSTHARAFTFFDANSSLTKFRNGSAQTQWGSNSIAPGTYASGLDQSSSSSNLLAIAQVLSQAAMAIAAKAP
jgi:hypothetical protein